jgi:hypothetical protein
LWHFSTPLAFVANISFEQNYPLPTKKRPEQHASPKTSLDVVIVIYIANFTQIMNELPCKDLD